MVKFNKSILLISASPGGLKPSQGYLVSRGWLVNETSDLKEALRIITSKQPEIVVACLDHPNKSINILLSLIRERLRCCVIATTQKSNLKNYSLLQEDAIEQKLFPPVSGPAIERCIIKYFKKMESLFGVVTTPDSRRSGISPKMFRINPSSPDNVIDYANLGNSRPFSLDLSSELKPFQPQHVLARGTDRVINDLLLAEENKSVKKPLGLATKMTCMLIESRHFNGYVVAAMGHDCHMDEIFTAIIYKHLVRFLEEQGEPVSATDIFQMNIKPVPFLSWASECAEFLKKSVHKGNEVAFAFFPVHGVRASYMPSASGEMLAVPIEEMYGNTKVDFDVYIFFPTNNRYVLYTPAGAIFYTHQQERLRERGVSAVHIKKENLKDLNRYRAQRYFHTIIDEYISGRELAA